MAIGKGSDFKIYDDQFYSGVMEGLDQKINGFNAASGGTIQLETDLTRGNYEYRSVFPRISNVVTRRDLTSTASVTDLAMTQDEVISVKINKKYGPVANTLDSWKKVGRDQREMSFLLGRDVGLEKGKDLINTGLLAVETAISGESGLNFDATGETTKTMTHDHLNSGLKKFGDAASDIRMLVFHSTPWFDLIGQAITDNVFQVAGMAIIEGTPASFGRPVLVIDAPALTDDNGSATDTYNTLGLVEGAVKVTNSEPETIAFELVTGREQLVYRFQAEYSFNIELKGFKWDVTNGGSNPTDATLGTAGNWDTWVSSDKLKPGVRVKTQ